MSTKGSQYDEAFKPDVKIVKIVNPKSLGVIIGTSHFMATPSEIAHSISGAGVEDFGVAFVEASGPQLVRTESSGDPSLLELATENAKRIGAGHAFIVVLGEGVFPVKVLSRIKNLDLVATIHCATNNPLQVVVAASDQGRGIIGIIDGKSPPKGVESVEDAAERQRTVRGLGYH
ncbi:adenosine specific kinase [Pseudoscourfieldia marina]